MSLSVHKASPRLPGGRLAFERAIRYSSLPAPTRHLALTIATWADIESGVIPDRFQPAQSTLEEATGLSRGAVFKHSKLLEAEGWLIREGGGGRSKRTKHVLRIPPGAPTSRAEKVSPGDRYQENVSPGEPETCHVTPETSHLVDENLSPGDTKSSCSSEESLGSTSSSVDASAEDVSDAVQDGGGGGDSDLRSIAAHITASLDYQGKPPTKTQRQTIEDRLVVWLAAGWSMDGLVVILDLTGQAVRHAPTLYAIRLDPANMPVSVPSQAPVLAASGIRGPLPSRADYEAATLNSVLFDEAPAPAPSKTWQEASERFAARTSGPLPGTDTTVAGWGAVARQLREPYKPYSNDAWHAPADPVAAAKIPWCGDVECEPRGRMREHIDDRGLKSDEQCEKCHPKQQTARF